MAPHTHLFRRTFHDSPIGMAILDEVGTYVELNGALAAILDYPADQVVGRNFAEFTHQDDLPRDVELMNQLASGQVPHYQVQKRYLRPNGDVVWTRVTVSDVDPDEEDAVRYFMVQVEDVTEIRRTKELLEQRALYDHLTGLANRTLLMDRLKHALASHRHRSATVACIFVDVDHFKVVNDSLGHEAGDALLAELAQRISAAVRKGDTVARLGGDEFVIVLENILSQSAAESLLQVIIAAIQQPFVIEGQELEPTVSAGLAMADPDTTADALVRNADMAMYTAKQAGRARVEIFDASLRASAMHKLSVETELRSAIREGELVVHYQPVVRLEDRSTVAFEALVRWDHPSRGLLLPEEFIAISEEANLVIPLGAFVLHEACQFIAARPEFTGRIFVNVSTRQIGAADFTRVVKSALAASGIEAERLGLEITESGMLVATRSAHADLESLTGLGVDLIVDDFGTGYSALSSVLQNPVSGLKLAREFTLRLGDHSTGDRISTAMASMIQSLGMYGVIEGVETEAQYSQAVKHGWTYGQGFLFGHPVPPEDIKINADGSVTVGEPASLC